MREKLILHPVYVIALSAVSVFITIQVYISGGIFPALFFALISFFAVYARLRFSIVIGDDGLVVRSLFKHRSIAYEKISQLIRTQEMGKGRERFIIRYREGVKNRHIVLPSYKYRNVGTFIDEVSRRSQCDIEEPHLSKPTLVKVLFIVMCAEVAFAVFHMLWRLGHTGLSALRGSYMWYNHYPIWIIVAIFMTFSLFRFFSMMKKGYHYLFYYRGVFFMIFSLVIMIFALSVTRVDTQAEMYAVLMQTRFENDRIQLEQTAEYSDTIINVLKHFSVKTSVSRGFNRVYSEVRFSVEKGLQDPSVVWVVPHVRAKFYASYLDSHGIVRYINESNTHVTQEEIRGAYSNNYK